MASWRTAPETGSRFRTRGTPVRIRSDGPEFAAAAVKGWIAGVGARTALVGPGSPWGNGHAEGLNGRFRDELLSCEVFNMLAEAKVPIERRRVHCNITRPRSCGRWLRQPAIPARPAQLGSEARCSTDICPGPFDGDRSVRTKI